MKKVLSLMLVLAMALALAACGGAAASTAASASTPASSTPASSAPVSSAPASSEAIVDDGPTYDLSVTLVNNTGADLAEVYLRTSNTESWGNNIVIGGGVFPNGATADLVFTLSLNTFQRDIKVVDDKGTSIEYCGIDLGTSSLDGCTITLEYNADTKEGTVIVE